MEKIEIYSSKKKSLLLLIGSIIFVALGSCLALGVFDANMYKRVIGALGVVFFGLGIYVAIKQLIKNKLMLVIDEVGVNINPSKSDEKILWQNIKGFPILNISGTKIIIIDIDNSHYWIEKETNKIRKQFLLYNYNNYGSPFNISSNAMQIKHDKLFQLLNQKLAMCDSPILKMKE